MFAAWALLRRHYERLQCLASIGLMFRVYEACVARAAAYASEIWAFQRFSQAFSTSRLDLATNHLRLLKENNDVRGNTATDIQNRQSWASSLHSMFGCCVQPNFGTTWLASFMAASTATLHWMEVWLLQDLPGAIGHGPCLRPSALQAMNQLFGLMPWISLISQPGWASLGSLGWTEYAVFVRQAYWGMRIILFWRALSCSASG